MYGILFDANLCVGCGACMDVCKEKNELPKSDGLVLSAADYTVVEEAGSEGDLYLRKMCMHCLEPACVSACLTRAMYKTPEGPVIWRGDKCMGCRYCMVSCPFEVPKLEYSSANPRIMKCRMCYERVAGGQGAEPVEMKTGPMELHIPGIRGIGNSIIYLIDRYDSGKSELSIYDIDFEYLEGVDRNPEGCGFTLIDHLTHNVYGGRMTYWADFYEKLFNFQEIRYFDIKGEYTGLTSKALTAPDGKIRIPLNEEGKSGGGQIEEFLREFNG